MNKNLSPHKIYVQKGKPKKKKKKKNALARLSNYLTNARKFLLVN